MRSTGNLSSSYSVPFLELSFICVIYFETILNNGRIRCCRSQVYNFSRVEIEETIQEFQCETASHSEMFVVLKFAISLILSKS